MIARLLWRACLITPSMVMSMMMTTSSLTTLSVTAATSTGILIVWRV